MFRPLFTLILLLQFNFLFSQRLEYNSSPPLSWDLFKANPPKTNPYAAMTYSSIKLWMKSEENTLKVTVEAFFESDKSWVKLDKKKDYLLNHEQRHFDLTEIYARKLREKVIKKQLSFSNAGKYLEKNHKKMIRKLEKTQTKYDKQTKHSQNREQQDKWDKKIDLLLDKYTDTRIELLNTLK